MMMDTTMPMLQTAFKNTLPATLLIGLLITCLSTVALAGVQAKLDRNRVYEGDPVILVIETDGRQSGEPDLAALDKDFRILGSNTSSQVRIINGRRSDKTSWTVQLEPRRLGTLRIPPISIGSEQTGALELEVTAIPEQVAARQSEHVFIEVEADTDGQSLYVQQQIPYTVRLYYDDQILNGALGAPQPEQAVVEQLGEDKRYAVTRNARRYNVIERHYAISAEKSGPLLIPPVSFKGEIASPKNTPGTGSYQSQLFERFFRNSPFGERGQPIRIHSKAVSVDIQSRPASAGNTWLPAEQLTLQDSWTESPPQFRAGEPVTRTLTLQAKGLTGAQLPDLQLEQPEQARLYPESPVNESRTDGDKVYGVSKQNFTYIPGKAGKLTIPAVELNWWDTHSNQPANARLPRWEFIVEPGVGGTQPPPAVKPENMSRTTAVEKPAPDTQLPPTGWFEQLKTFKYWTMAGAVLLFLTLVLFAAKRLQHIKRATPAVKPALPAEQDSRTRIKHLVPQLERACALHDARAAAHALLELGRTRWPDDPPRNLGVLATRLGQGYAQIMALDRAMYAADKAQWNGSDLWHSIKDVWTKKPTEEKKTADSLKPLYPEST
jgi:hypothetical protein